MTRNYVKISEKRRLAVACIDMLRDYGITSVAAGHNFVMDHTSGMVMDSYTIYMMTPLDLTIIIPELCGYED